MDFKKLNDTIKVALGEDVDYIEPDNNLEHINIVQDIKNGTYEGEELDRVVLENFDEFSVEDLAKILDNYKYYTQCGGNGLLPSGWIWSHENETYPKKLAEAICISEQAECAGLSDLFNIFYRQHGNMDIWGEAADVWADNVLQNMDAVQRDLKQIDEDGSYTQDVIDELEDKYPALVDQLKEIAPEVDYSQEK